MAVAPKRTRPSTQNELIKLGVCRVEVWRTGARSSPRISDKLAVAILFRMVEQQRRGARIFGEFSLLFREARKVN